MIAAAAVMTRAVPAATRGLITRFLALHDRVPGAIPGLVDALTEREREIVALVATGMLNAEAMASHDGSLRGVAAGR